MIGLDHGRWRYIDLGHRARLEYDGMAVMGLRLRAHGRRVAVDVLGNRVLDAESDTGFAVGAALVLNDFHDLLRQERAISDLRAALRIPQSRVVMVQDLARRLVVAYRHIGLGVYERVALVGREPNAQRYCTMYIRAPDTACNAAAENDLVGEDDAWGLRWG